MKVLYFADQAEAFTRLVAPMLRDTVIGAPVKSAADLPDEYGATFVVVQSLSAEIPPQLYTALRAKGYTIWHVADSWTRHRIEQDKLNAAEVAKPTEIGSEIGMPRGAPSTGVMEG